MKRFLILCFLWILPILAEGAPHPGISEEDARSPEGASASAQAPATESERVEAGDRGPLRLTLEQALVVAFARSPVLKARQAEAEEARGREIAARTYPFNPELEVESGSRSTPGGDVTDRGVLLSQEIEIGGQRGKRVAAARAELSAAEALLLRQRRLLTAQVKLAFAEALRARELLRVADTDAGLARDFLHLSERRIERGAASQIEVNLARAAAGRAGRRADLARAAYDMARSFLAETLGLGALPAPEPEGELREPAGEVPPLAELLLNASNYRADLDSFHHLEEAAEARLRLARAEVIPNLRLSGFYREEEGTDRITGGGITISLPLLNRNQGGILEARATIARSSAEKEAFGFAIQREVASAFASYRAARASARRLREQVLGTLEENLSLVQRSFTAGKIGATEVLVFRREFVDSQREFIETVFESLRAKITLDLASGRLSTPELEPPSPAREPGA